MHVRVYVRAVLRERAARVCLVPRTSMWGKFRMRWMLSLLVVAVMCTVLSAHEAYVCLNNKTPLTTTLARYLKDRPENDWLRLENAHVRMDQAIVIRSVKNGQIQAVYVPVWPDDHYSRPVELVLDVTHTRKGQVDRGGYENESIETISGLVRPHWMDDCPEPRFAGLSWHKTAAPVVLIENRKPDSRIAFGAGVAALLFWSILLKIVFGVGDIDRWHRADATDSGPGAGAGRSAFDFYGAPSQPSDASAAQHGAMTRA
jgi:hypothetical protein